MICARFVTVLSQIGLRRSDESAMKSRLDQVVRSYTEKHAFTGTVLIAEGDRVLLNQGYGMADIEWGIPNVPDAKFRVGSVTKQFTDDPRLALAAG